MPAPTALHPLSFDALLAEARTTADLDGQAYFLALAAGEAAFSRADFVETQIQFLFAVVFFAEPMRALAARLGEGPARDALLANIADEEGNGDATASHETTFLTLLARLGASREDIDRRALWPEVRAFDDALMGLALRDDLTVALAAFGMIEARFAVLSARLGRAIAHRGYLAPRDIPHYAVHETLDHDHAEGFFAAVRGAADTPAGAYAVQQGLALGSYLLLRLFDDFYRVRDRRLLRPDDGQGRHPGGIALRPASPQP